MIVQATVKQDAVLTYLQQVCTACDLPRCTVKRNPHPDTPLFCRDLFVRSARDPFHDNQGRVFSISQWNR